MVCSPFQRRAEDRQQFIRRLEDVNDAPRYAASRSVVAAAGEDGSGSKLSECLCCWSNSKASEYEETLSEMNCRYRHAGLRAT